MIVEYIDPVIPPRPDVGSELRRSADRRMRQIMIATRNTLRVEEAPRGRKDLKRGREA